MSITEQPSPAEIEAAARVMFEPPSVPPGEDAYTWAQMVAEDPSRADMWRQDAHAALVAAQAVRDAQDALAASLHPEPGDDVLARARALRAYEAVLDTIADTVIREVAPKTPGQTDGSGS